MKELIEIYSKKGIAGVNRYLKKVSNRSIVWRILIKLDQRFFVFSNLFSFTEAQEKLISTHGIQKAAESFLKKLGISYSLKPPLPNLLRGRKKGVLIVGVNHPGFFEPIILLSLIKRKKVKLIINRFFYLAGKNFQKYTLPVTARLFAKEKKSDLVTKFNLYHRLYRAQLLSENQIDRMNEVSLKSGTRCLERGGVVILFPGGGGSEKKVWRNGLSKLVHTISENKRKNVILLPVYFEGVGEKRMIVRIYRSFRAISQNPLRVSVQFGKPTNLQRFLKGFDDAPSENHFTEVYRTKTFEEFAIPRPNISFVYANKLLSFVLNLNLIKGIILMFERIYSGRA